MRIYQAQRRGSVCWKAMAEDAAILIAVAYGEITEGCAAKALNTDRVSLRGLLQDALRVAAERTGAAVDRDERLEPFTAVACQSVVEPPGGLNRRSGRKRKVRKEGA